MKGRIYFILFFTISLLFSCVKDLDFDQVEDLELSQVSKVELFTFSLEKLAIPVANNLFELKEVTKFSAFRQKIVKNHLDKFTLGVSIDNTINRALEIKIKFLDKNKTDIYEFKTIEVEPNYLGYSFSEDVDFGSNQELLNTRYVEIDLSVKRNKEGKDLEFYSDKALTFDSSVTLYTRVD